MNERLEPPDDTEGADSQEQNFEPVMTREVLVGTEARIRDEVLKAPVDPSSGGVRASGANGNTVESEALPVMLPACLEVEQATRAAKRRLWGLVIILSLVSLVQVIVYFGIGNRDPVRIYDAGSSNFLVQP